MNKKSGFIDTIILVVIALIILGFFNIDIKNILSAPVVKANLLYLWDITKLGFAHAVEYVKNVFAGV